MRQEHGQALSSDPTIDGRSVAIRKHCLAYNHMLCCADKSRIAVPSNLKNCLISLNFRVSIL